MTRNIDPPNPEELATVAALRAALRRFSTATDDVTAQQGLTPRQYDLLAVLHHSSDEIASTPTAIAKELCLSRSATTELLTRAEKAGLIDRSSDKENARRKRVRPTPEGSKRFFSAVVELRTERTRLLELLHLAAGLAAVLPTG